MAMVNERGDDRQVLSSPITELKAALFHSFRTLWGKREWMEVVIDVGKTATTNRQSVQQSVSGKQEFSYLVPIYQSDVVNSVQETDVSSVR
jgi:hypothetical protein